MRTGATATRETQAASGQPRCPESSAAPHARCAVPALEVQHEEHSEITQAKNVSSQWPPRWSGPHEQGDKLPMGENGVTFKAATLMKNHIHLSVQFGNKDWVGVIESKDKEFLKRVYELLRNCEGQSLKQIGDLEIEET